MYVSYFNEMNFFSSPLAKWLEFSQKISEDITEIQFRVCALETLCSRETETSWNEDKLKLNSYITLDTCFNIIIWKRFYLQLMQF